jgi:hypothetical protein
LETFRVYFSRRRWYLAVYLEPVTPATFQRRGGGRWGWYLATDGRARKGQFGEIHLVESRVREDVVAHELAHVLFDWLGGRPVLTDRFEERVCGLFDELTRHFWKEYEKAK